ncbi:hypothetical protein KIH39_22665 [Telmatocola sphagniphila]|uniref:Uncharacterized protein n=1 Tax=Telmatocola sphagniphila TaxID=1123043 RepID=A0A8E6B495_9BACT|nr:hypothetical protein [Telmatocola sphagniphila]QVL31617.1 hypothetical protein KIH39_22665 [Telmatocola sphagniphila]
MIHLQRRQVRQLRSLFKKLGAARCPAPTSLLLKTDSSGLSIQGSIGEVTAIYRLPGSFADEQMTIPFAVFNDTAGSDDSVVEIVALVHQKLRVAWSSGTVPQIREYEIPASVESWSLPEVWTPMDLRLREALTEAMKTASAEATRFAVNYIQLRGRTGEVIGTDSRQLFIESGFPFPWEDDLLIPRCGLLGVEELKGDSLEIGRTASHMWLRLGAWMIALQIASEARYPEVHRAIPASLEATRWRIDPGESHGLAQCLKQLPGEKDPHRPVTVELNGHVAIRARGTESLQTTEVHLNRSQVEGNPLSLALDRDYLRRALQLGFSEFQIVDPDKPIVCQEGSRRFVCMPLGKSSVVASSSEAIRVELLEPQRELKPKSVTAQRLRQRAQSFTSALLAGLLEEAEALQSLGQALIERLGSLSLEIQRLLPSRRPELVNANASPELQPDPFI